MSIAFWFASVGGVLAIFCLLYISGRIYERLKIGTRYLDIPIHQYIDEMNMNSDDAALFIEFLLKTHEAIWGG